MGDPRQMRFELTTLWSDFCFDGHALISGGLVQRQKVPMVVRAVNLRPFPPYRWCWPTRPDLG